MNTCSMSAFLPSIQQALAAYLSDLSLTKHARKEVHKNFVKATRGQQEQQTTDQSKAQPENAEQPPIPVYIGDLPEDAKESPFPCVILLPLSGFAEGGEFFEELAIMAGVYNGEKGDAEGQEMELSLLIGHIAHFLHEALEDPINNQFTCIRDERGRYMRWQRTDIINQPSPFAQATLITTWSMLGWQ